MKNVKELNKLVDAASVGVLKTINALIDPMTLVESDRFIRSETALGEATGEGVICGFAQIDEADVGVFAINGDVLKGGVGVANAEKIAKLIANCKNSGNRLVGILDTSGARFSEGIDALEGYGKIFAAFTETCDIVPTALVVKGNNYGMLSYLCSIAPFTVCYDKSATATSSPLILAAGTTADAAKVGTGEVMAKEGIASVVVKSDAEMAKAVKTYFAYLNKTESADDPNRTAKSLKAGASVDTVIAEVFDTASFFELKKAYAPEVRVGIARLNGETVGVVATDSKKGKLTPDGAAKISWFMHTYHSTDRPYGFNVINLVDCGGAANCLACQGKLIREIGEMINCYNHSNFACVSLIYGSAIGLGYTAFASKSKVDYVIAWESANIGLLDDIAAAELVYADQIAKAKDRDAAAKKLAAAYGEENTSALAVAQKGYIDNVINPSFSRQYLIAALRAFSNVYKN